MIAFAIAISLRRVSDREAKYLKEDRFVGIPSYIDIVAPPLARQFIISSTIISFLSKLAFELLTVEEIVSGGGNCLENIDYRGDVDPSRCV